MPGARLGGSGTLLAPSRHDARFLDYQAPSVALLSGYLLSDATGSSDGDTGGTFLLVGR